MINPDTIIPLHNLEQRIVAGVKVIGLDTKSGSPVVDAGHGPVLLSYLVRIGLDNGEQTFTDAEIAEIGNLVKDLETV